MIAWSTCVPLGLHVGMRTPFPGLKPRALFLRRFATQDSPSNSERDTIAPLFAAAIAPKLHFLNFRLR